MSLENAFPDPVGEVFAAMKMEEDRENVVLLLALESVRSDLERFTPKQRLEYAHDLNQSVHEGHESDAVSPDSFGVKNAHFHPDQEKTREEDPPFQAKHGKYRARRGMTQGFQDFLDGMKLVYVCSPFHGATKEERELNIAVAEAFSSFVCACNAVPVTPHLLYPRFLNDDAPEERAAGLLCGQKLLSLCDEVWVLPDGEPTEGMQREIEYARLIRKPVCYFNMMVDEDDEDGGSVE